MCNRVEETAEAIRLARRAVEWGRDDAFALSQAGYVLARLAREPEAGDALIERALALNPNLATAWLWSGWVKIFLGRSDLAIKDLAHCMRLSPFDWSLGMLGNPQAQVATALAYFCMGRYDEAAFWAEKILGEEFRMAYISALRVAAASHALAGRLEEAQRAMVVSQQLDPTLRVSNLKDRLPPLRPEHFARLAEGLRKAGLPE